jgi:hypothetical protein
LNRRSGDQEAQVEQEVRRVGEIKKAILNRRSGDEKQIKRKTPNILISCGCSSCSPVPPAQCFTGDQEAYFKQEVRR